MGKIKDQLLGKLDLLVLRILDSGESIHGYSIANRAALGKYSAGWRRTSLSEELQ